MRIRLAVADVVDASADALVRVVGDRSDPVLEAAGPEVRDELRVRGRSRLLREAEALTTGAGALHATWLIHVRCPRFAIGTDRSWLLSRSYRSVLEAADDVLAATVAMPALGTTAVYWPLEEAARIGVLSLRGSVSRVRDVTLLLPSAAGLEPFAEALARG